MMNENKYTESIKSMRNRTTRLEREGDYWTENERETLVRMFHGGVGITEMSMCLQRTEPATIQQIEKLDLYSRKQYPRRQKSFPKEPACLCENCQLDGASCPRCKACEAEREGR